MGKAQAIADRIKSTKKRFDDALDGVAKTLDEYDALEPQVVSGTQTIVATLKADANELLSEMRQLSNNLPLDGSEPSAGGSNTGHKGGFAVPSGSLPKTGGGQ